MKEADIQREIQMAVSNTGCRVFRNQAGRYNVGPGKWVTSGLCLGASDLIGWTPMGKFLAIEVKTRKGRLSKAQRAFLCAVNRSNGIGIVAFSAKDALDKLERLGVG